jgi:protein TonB
MPEMAYFRGMIRFTRIALTMSALALSAATFTSCADGEGSATPPTEQLDTTSEVVSAEFPGGAAKVMEFIAGEVSYPESARDSGVEGKVFVDFTISESGAVANAKVLKPLHPALDSAAVAAAMSMPAWSPATKDGVPVETTITLPIFFRL